MQASLGAWKPKWSMTMILKPSRKDASLRMEFMTSTTIVDMCTLDNRRTLLNLRLTYFLAGGNSSDKLSSRTRLACWLSATVAAAMAIAHAYGKRNSSKNWQILWA